LALVVQKFCGTSVADLERIQAVAARIKRAHDEGDRLAVVVSAMAGDTNRLADWVLQIAGPRHDRAEYDVVVAGQPAKRNHAVGCIRPQR
jgi:aspartate kinase